MEEITIEFTPEILNDIDKQQVSKVAIDFLLNYEDGLLNLNELEACKKEFLDKEYYYYVEAITRAIKAIKLIFVFE